MLHSSKRGHRLKVTCTRRMDPRTCEIGTVACKARFTTSFVQSLPTNERSPPYYEAIQVF